jgi:hypothetical protein
LNAANPATVLQWGETRSVEPAEPAGFAFDGAELEISGMSTFEIKERRSTVEGESWRHVGQIQAPTAAAAARAAARYVQNAYTLAGRLIEAKAVRLAPR